MSNYIPLECCKFFGQYEDEICYGEVNFIEDRHAGTRFSTNEIYYCEGHKSGKYISKKIIEEIESIPREIRRSIMISLCKYCSEYDLDFLDYLCEIYKKN